PANLYDFSFLAPCPSSGLIIHGDKDAVVPPRDVTNLVEKLKTQKGIVIEQKIVPGANDFFDGKVEPLMQSISGYLDKRLKGSPRLQSARSGRSMAQIDATKNDPRGGSMRNSHIVAGCLVAGIVGMGAAVAQNAATPDTIKIGIVIPMTGTSAAR